MTAYLTLLTYKKRYIPIAFMSMAVFHLPMLLNKKNKFYKLLGTGKNAGFSFWPNLNVWGILTVQNEIVATKEPNLLKLIYGNFIAKWVHFFCNKKINYILQPIECHGLWDNKKAFGELPVKSDYDGEIAVLTRATIRLSKLSAFWKNVGPVSEILATVPGLIKSYGIGEVPWIKQATFSIWQNKQAMKNYAYSMQKHKEVIAKTRKEKWYKEEMFVRFKVEKIVIIE